MNDSNVLSPSNPDWLLDLVLCFSVFFTFYNLTGAVLIHCGFYGGAL